MLPANLDRADVPPIVNGSNEVHEGDNAPSEAELGADGELSRILDSTGVCRTLGKLTGDA